MDNLFQLMILYLVYTGLSFWLFNGNFLSPCFIFSLSLSAMLCLAYYTAVTMGMLFAIGIRTFSIFAIAGIIFIATELCVYLLRASSCSLKLTDIHTKYEPLIIDRQIQICITLFFALSVLFAVYVLYINTPGGGWSSRMRAFKNLVLNKPDSLRYRFITSQMYKINIITVDLLGYVMIYNLTVCGVPVKQVLSYIIDSALYAVFSVVYSGARQSAIEIILFLIMIYLSLNMKPTDRKKIYRFMRRAVPVLILTAALFTASGSLVGRVETEKSSLQNLAEYICGGLYFFNKHLDDPGTKVFGQASFAYAYSAVRHLGINIGNFESMIKGEFDIYGNTVTIFGRWYKDFGTSGVFIGTFIVALIYSLTFYHRLIYTNNIKREHHLTRIFYCQFMTGLIWAGYDDRVASLLTTQNVIFLIFTSFLFWLLIDKKFKLI